MGHRGLSGNVSRSFSCGLPVSFDPPCLAQQGNVKQRPKSGEQDSHQPAGNRIRVVGDQQPMVPANKQEDGHHPSGHQQAICIESNLGSGRSALGCHPPQPADQAGQQHQVKGQPDPVVRQDGQDGYDRHGPRHGTNRVPAEDFDGNGFGCQGGRVRSLERRPVPFLDFKHAAVRSDDGYPQNGQVNRKHGDPQPDLGHQGWDEEGD